MKNLLNIFNSDKKTPKMKKLAINFIKNINNNSDIKKDEILSLSINDFSKFVSYITFLDNYDEKKISKKMIDIKNEFILINSYSLYEKNKSSDEKNNYFIIEKSVMKQIEKYIDKMSLLGKYFERIDYLVYPS